jgi:hypothetical protein
VRFLQNIFHYSRPLPHLGRPRMSQDKLVELVRSYAHFLHMRTALEQMAEGAQSNADFASWPSGPTRAQGVAAADNGGDGIVSEKAQTWLPYDLMGEMIPPPPRNSPDDWIDSLDDGAPAIIAGVGHGGTAQKICILRDGEVVKFCSMTPHGSAILTLKSERQWSVDRPMPQEAEQVCAINGWQIDRDEPDPECRSETGHDGLPRCLAGAQ